MSIIKIAFDCFEKIKSYNWYFELENNSIVKLSFDDEHFTHLILGTSLIKHLKQYKGKAGYQNISNITFDKLKIEITKNPTISNQVQSVKKRIKNFIQIENILLNPIYFFYDVTKVNCQNKNDIKATYALRLSNSINISDLTEDQINQQLRTTFFIREIQNSEYIGVTCIVDNSSYKHTCNQDKIKVKKAWQETKS